jgi:hypothetical protein
MYGDLDVISVMRTWLMRSTLKLELIEVHERECGRVLIRLVLLR